MNPDPEKATRIAPGVTLSTLDGAKIGNAIVIRLIGTKNGRTYWWVETDFGNRCKFSEQEIHDLFGLKYVSTYAEWHADRQALLNQTHVEPQL